MTQRSISRLLPVILLFTLASLAAAEAGRVTLWQRVEMFGAIKLA